MRNVPPRPGHPQENEGRSLYSSAEFVPECFVVVFVVVVVVVVVVEVVFSCDSSPFSFASSRFLI